MTEKKISEMTDEELAFLLSTTRADTALAEQLNSIFNSGREATD